MREKENGAGFIIALLLIIIMFLIGYIAYNKGLEKSSTKKDLETTNTTETVTTKEIDLINKTYLYEDICKEDDCNINITSFELENGKVEIDLKTIKENEKHIINLSGELNKNIELNKFKYLKIINSEFFIIKSSSDKTEEDKLLLFDNHFIKLDEIIINNLKEEAYNDLSLIIYTYETDCETNLENYFSKDNIIISKSGFEIINSTKGPLKEDGLLCNKPTTN